MCLMVFIQLWGSCFYGVAKVVEAIGGGEFFPVLNSFEVGNLGIIVDQNVRCGSAVHLIFVSKPTKAQNGV